MSERGRWKVKATVEKYKGDYATEQDIIDAGVEPYEVIESEGNLLLNEGINEVWQLLCTTGGTAYNNANAYIGVGNSSTAAAAGQTDLQGASKDYQAMESGYPTTGSQKATWKSQWGSGDGNFAWEEWTVCNASSGSGDNLNRKVQSLGTKSSGETWTLTVEITLA